MSRIPTEMVIQTAVRTQQLSWSDDVIPKFQFEL